jgi:hypothetical protein
MKVTPGLARGTCCGEFFSLPAWDELQERCPCRKSVATCMRH